MNSFLLKYGIDKVHYNVDILIHNPTPAVRACIASQHTLLEHHIDKLIKDTVYGVRWILAKNPILSEKHYDVLINDRDGIRRRLLLNPKLPKKYLDLLLNDSSPTIQMLARTHLSNENKKPKDE